MGQAIGRQFVGDHGVVALVWDGERCRPVGRHQEECALACVEVLERPVGQGTAQEREIFVHRERPAATARPERRQASLGNDGTPRGRIVPPCRRGHEGELSPGDRGEPLMSGPQVNESDPASDLAGPFGAPALATVGLRARLSFLPAAQSLPRAGRGDLLVSTRASPRR